MKGIDISMHNGTIDFSAVKNSGVEVVIIKSTEGTGYVDPYLEQHYSGAKSAGLNIGFYHFMSEKTNPSDQAVDFWNAIKDKEFNILPCLDIETNSRGRSATEITDRCLEFVNKFKELSGMTCMVYTGGYFGRDNLDSRLKDMCYGWIAHYGVDAPMETGFHVVGHQYTEKGSIRGVNGNCDVNNFTDDIFLNKAKKEEEKKVEYLVVVQRGADQHSAEILADYLNCPVITNDRRFDYTCVKNIIGVGGEADDYTSYLTKLISGADRYATNQAVLDFIKNGGK